MNNIEKIEEFIASEKERNDAFLADKIREYFTGMELADKHAFAFQMFTDFPFGVLSRFHHAWADDAGLAADGSVEEYTERDRAGHVAMQTENIASFFSDATPKTDGERFDYFSGISSVFPLMMTANYHRWLSSALENPGDIDAFIDSYKPVIEQTYHGPLKEAYASGSAEAKIAAYTNIAQNNLYEILREYYARYLSPVD